MPLTLNCGLTRKAGLPDYGSIGAMCSVEVELPHDILVDDLEGFYRRVRDVYAACAQAVNDELTRQQADTAGHDSSTVTPASQSSASPCPTESTGQQNGNGSHPNGQNGHPASEKQAEYIRQLARQIPGLGARRLDALSQKMFGKAVAAISSFQASSLIDTLKAIKKGEIDLEKALNENAS